MPLARTGRPISRRKKRVIPRPMVQPSVEDLSRPNTGYNPSSRAQLSSAVAVPTEGDIGGPRVTARRVCADPVHVVVRELTPADGRTAFCFACFDETVVAEDAVVSTTSG